MTDAAALDVLEQTYQHVSDNLDAPQVPLEYSRQIEGIVRSSIGAGLRLLLAATLAKTLNPSLDIRKPFSSLGEHAYSGRTYDERFVQAFILRHGMPCNMTTAFLTPALRTKQIVLARGTSLGGRDSSLYATVIELLNDIHEQKVPAQPVLAETIRLLTLRKQEHQQRVDTLLRDLMPSSQSLVLSCEDIVSLIQRHLAQPRTSRLPVLVVAAAYQAAAAHLDRQIFQLNPHTAADEKTRSLGDVEIALRDDHEIVTVYEMKAKHVTPNDIDLAVAKLARSMTRVDNYIFITTHPIDALVSDYAAQVYRRTHGVEFAILDCVGFLRHFLHLFHRLRIQFLNAYQTLLLDEPSSAVRDTLKEAFLALRRDAEISLADPETDDQT